MDKVTPLTHEERRRLIEQPLRIRTIGGTRHGGTSVVSEDGLHRTYTPRIAAVDDDPSTSGVRTDGE